LEPIEIKWDSVRGSAAEFRLNFLANQGFPDLFIAICPYRIRVPRRVDRDCMAVRPAGIVFGRRI
jgi:hypothetical protein